MISKSFKITREMKLALTGVVFVGAVGGWFTLTTGQEPEVAPVTPAPPTSDATRPPASADAGLTVKHPEKPIEVQQIPFLTAQTPETTSDEQQHATSAASASTDDVLVNPFRPLALDVTAAEARSDQPVQAAKQVAQTPVPTPQPVVTASVSPAPAVIPALGRPVPLPTANVVNAAPFPVPSSAPVVSAKPLPVRVAPPITVPSTPSVTQVNAVPAAPKPPIPTLRTPAAPSVVVTGATNTVSSSSAENTPPLPATAVPPVLMTAESTAVPAPQDPLDVYVAEQTLHYNAVVLGPVNTAIFQTKSGYLVVSIGQKLPDSDILVKDITTSSVTLALGDSLKTLELDKR